MALIIRIVTFIITLFFIILLLLGATTSFSTEWYESDLYPKKFRVLSPKELLIDQLNIQNEFKEIESHEEWTERAYLYYPLVEFDDDEDVIICGAQLIIIEPSGHNIKYEFITNIENYELKHHVLLRSVVVSLNNVDEQDYEQFEQKLYGFEIVKDNQLVTNLFKPENSSKHEFDYYTPSNFTANGGQFYKTILEGGYDIRTFFAPEMSRVIPVAKNRWFLSHPKSIIDNCIHELKNNQYKLKKPKGEVFEEAYHRTG